MIDPIHSLAFSIQANIGVYAILLGSGVSRAARIPTGWDITLDLVRKLAALHGEPCDPEPERWYLNKFGKAADYSELLDALAKTPAERQQLLRTYWEPSEQEREEGAKQPTEAHRAIATLTAQGFVKVIITTNFDRLIESALVDVGIVPTILSSPDQVHGALPLIHTQCCVFKVHGDYLDTRIRNTPTELDSYPVEFDRLLDRILDEFGLVVCGWSAAWDAALRNALLRAPSRRFATYWATRGESNDEARRLIEHRSSQKINIKDANSFFQTVQRYVESLEQFSRPHPLSTEAAVASLKRFLSEPKFRIHLADLIDDTVSRVVEVTSSQSFAAQRVPTPTDALATAHVRAYEAASSTILAMAAVGGYWADEDHCSVWSRALARLSASSGSSRFDLWLELQRYPGTLLLYALGIGAVEADRLRFLGCLLGSAIYQENREDVRAVQRLPAARLFSQGRKHARFLEGMNDSRTPLSDWLRASLRQVSIRLIPNDDRYTFVFDCLEILMALSYAYQMKQTKDYEYRVPIGAFGYRTHNRERFLREIEESIQKRTGESPFVRSGIFGDTAEACTQALADFKAFVSETCGRWW